MTDNIIFIDSLDTEELSVYSKLNEPQLLHINEPLPGLFIAESPNVILLALKAGYEPVSLLIDTKSIETEGKSIISLCPEGMPVYAADLEVLTKITGFCLTRGLLCAMKRKEKTDALSLIKDKHRIAILESVNNPTNVGAIMRSAAALNVEAVLLTPDCADPLYRRALRVSMGTIFQIPWAYICSSIEEWKESGIGILRESGYISAAMALKDNSIRIDDPLLKSYDRLAIILGNEGYGLCDQTLSKCDHSVIIPMSHNVDSLNVAAASAVAFWELNK